MPKITITFLITDLNIGGTPRMLRDLAIGLADSGRFTPTVVSLAPLGPIAADLQDHGIRVESLQVRRPRQILTAIIRWRQLLPELDPDLVYSLLVHANLVATLGRRFGPKRTRYLQALHTMQPKPRWHWWLQRRIAGRSEVMIAPAQCILDRLRRNKELPNGVVIPNGIDIAKFQRQRLTGPADGNSRKKKRERRGPPVPTPIKAEPAPAEIGKAWPWPAGARVIGYLGRFDPVKRLSWLLQAFEQIASVPNAPQNLHLVLVGYGPHEKLLRAQAQRLSTADRIHFVPPVSDPERWLKALSCFVLPSEAEGQPLSVIEALVAQVPVVAFDIPAVREVVGPDYPLVKDPAPEALAIGIQEVINGSRTAESLSDAAVQAASRFSVRQMVGLHRRVLEQIFNAR